MRRELTDLIGSGLLLAALVTATIGALAPTTGASASVPTPATQATAADRGEMLFNTKGCAGCHTRNIGPDLTGLAERAGSRKPGMSAVDYVRESIRTPGAFIAPTHINAGGIVMPDLGLSDDEIDALVAYLLRSR